MWNSTSASQIKNFQSCKRKWFRESVLGERQPPTKAALRGQEIHRQLEEYLINGSPCEDGTAQALSKLLPPAASQTPFNVEVKIEWTPEGWPVSVKGFIDLILEDENKIIDHKSTSSLSYALSENAAKKDPQAIIYCGAAMLQENNGMSFPKEHIRFALNYGTTRGVTKTNIVEIELTKAEIKEGLKLLGEVVHEQKALSVLKTWQEVPPNFGSCDKFGGCPFRNDCKANATPQINEVLDLSNSNSVERFKELLDQRRKAAFMHLEPSGEQYESINPPDGLEDGLIPEQETKKKRLKYEGKALSSLKANELKEAVLSFGKDPQKTMKENKALLISLLESGASKIQNAPPAMDSFFILANAELASQETIEEDVPRETIEEAITPDKEPLTPSLNKLLLIDCHAIGAVDLEVYLAPMIKHIEFKFGLPISVIKYAEGWKELAGLIGVHGWEGSGLGEIVRIDSSSPLWTHSSHAILPHAFYVIRGTR